MPCAQILKHACFSKKSTESLKIIDIFLRFLTTRANCYPAWNTVLATFSKHSNSRTFIFKLYFYLVIHQLRKVARMYQFLRICVRSGMFQERGLRALRRSEEGPFLAYPQLHCPASLTTPEFDEQYVDYGQNKLIWIFRLRLLDYKFRVLYHSFAVHVPHPSSSYDGYLHSMRNKGKLTEMDLHMKVGSLRWVGRRNSSRSCDREELRCARCFPCVRGQSSLFCGVWSNRNSRIIELCVCLTQIMSPFGSFPLDDTSAFLYTLGTTGAVALSIMAFRFFNLCSSSASRKLLHICTIPILK